MVNDEILYIRRRLKKKMDEDRFEHTIGVAYTSVCLAMRYGEDLHKAELAGLAGKFIGLETGKETKGFNGMEYQPVGSDCLYGRKKCVYQCGKSYYRELSHKGIKDRQPGGVSGA